MIVRTIAIAAIIILGVCQLVTAESANRAGKERKAHVTGHESHSADDLNSKPSRRTHARAKITVQNSTATPYDQTASPTLMMVHLNETFTGDIEGTSPACALEVLHRDKSARLVSVQRFTGKLGGRQGTFVLEGQETVENGKIKATWLVVPGSGTGELSGLRGEGGFEGEFGKGSIGTLDYWFE